MRFLTVQKLGEGSSESKGGGTRRKDKEILIDS